MRIWPDQIAPVLSLVLTTLGGAKPPPPPPRRHPIWRCYWSSGVPLIRPVVTSITSWSFSRSIHTRRSGSFDARHHPDDYWPLPVSVIGSVVLDMDGVRIARVCTYVLYDLSIAAIAPAITRHRHVSVWIWGELPSLPAPQPREPTKELGDAETRCPVATPPKPIPAGDMERKLINDARTYIRSLTQQRGSNDE